MLVNGETLSAEKPMFISMMNFEVAKRPWNGAAACKPEADARRGTLNIVNGGQICQGITLLYDEFTANGNGNLLREKSGRSLIFFPGPPVASS